MPEIKQINGQWFYAGPGKESGEFARIYGPFPSRAAAEMAARPLLRQPECDMQAVLPLLEKVLTGLCELKASK